MAASSAVAYSSRKGMVSTRDTLPNTPARPRPSVIRAAVRPSTRPAWHPSPKRLKIAPTTARRVLRAAFSPFGIVEGGETAVGGSFADGREVVDCSECVPRRCRPICHVEVAPIARVARLRASSFKFEPRRCTHLAHPCSAVLRPLCRKICVNNFVRWFCTFGSFS